jgi:predicted NAD/FAD-dependent oxidoreductase
MATPSRRLVVIGAGPAGLTAAFEAQRSGFDVTVLEKDPVYVGGISRTVRHQGNRFDIGGHRFFSKSDEIMRWWKERLPDDFIQVRRMSRIYYPLSSRHDEPHDRRRSVSVTPDGVLVLAEASPCHPATPGQIQIGKNPLGESTCGERSSGHLPWIERGVTLIP